MTFHDNIGDEKVQYDINREEAKISGLIKKKVIEQAKFTYSPLRKLKENKQKQLKIKTKPTKSK